MSFIIQRGINPQHLPIQRWYEALAHRPVQRDSETVITVGGKPAIRRGPLVKAVTVHTVDGKTVSERGMVPDNTGLCAAQRNNVRLDDFQPIEFGAERDLRQRFSRR